MAGSHSRGKGKENQRALRRVGEGSDDIDVSPWMVDYDEMMNV